MKPDMPALGETGPTKSDTSILWFEAVTKDAEEVTMIKAIYDQFAEARRKMIEEQMAMRGIHDKAVLNAFGTVPRELFVDEENMDKAYEDYPLPTLSGQTLSQPYMMALMTQLLELPADSQAKVLEIGSGSGYQAAILAHMGHKVVSIERLQELADLAKENLFKLTYADNVKILVRDGCLGCPEEAPFDGVIVTAAAPKIPKKLIEQTRIGGKIVIPVGDIFIQELLQVVKISDDEIKINHSVGCRFVPLIGKDGFLE